MLYLLLFCATFQVAAGAPLGELVAVDWLKADGIMNDVASNPAALVQVGRIRVLQ